MNEAEPLVLLLGTDHVLEIPALTNGDTGAAATGATVTATLLGPDGAALAGQTWPLVLTEDPALSGRYRGTLSADLALTDTAPLTDGLRLVAMVEATATSGLRRLWQSPVRTRKG